MSSEPDISLLERSSASQQFDVDNRSLFERSTNDFDESSDSDIMVPTNEEFKSNDGHNKVPYHPLKDNQRTDIHRSRLMKPGTPQKSPTVHLPSQDGDKPKDSKPEQEQEGTLRGVMEEVIGATVDGLTQLIAPILPKSFSATDNDVQKPSSTGSDPAHSGPKHHQSIHPSLKTSGDRTEAPQNKPSSVSTAGSSKKPVDGKSKENNMVAPSGRINQPQRGAPQQGATPPQQQQQQHLSSQGRQAPREAIPQNTQHSVKPQTLGHSARDEKKHDPGHHRPMQQTAPQQTAGQPKKPFHHTQETIVAPPKAVGKMEYIDEADNIKNQPQINTEHRRGSHQEEHQPPRISQREGGPLKSTTHQQTHHHVTDHERSVRIDPLAKRNQNAGHHDEKIATTQPSQNDAIALRNKRQAFKHTPPVASRHDDIEQHDHAQDQPGVVRPKRSRGANITYATKPTTNDAKSGGIQARDVLDSKSTQQQQRQRPSTQAAKGRKGFLSMQYEPSPFLAKPYYGDVFLNAIQPDVELGHVYYQRPTSRKATVTRTKTRTREQPTVVTTTYQKSTAPRLPESRPTKIHNSYLQRSSEMHYPALGVTPVRTVDQTYDHTYYRPITSIDDTRSTRTVSSTKMDDSNRSRAHFVDHTRNIRDNRMDRDHHHYYYTTIPDGVNRNGGYHVHVHSYDESPQDTQRQHQPIDIDGRMFHPHHHIYYEYDERLNVDSKKMSDTDKMLDKMKDMEEGFERMQELDDTMVALSKQLALNLPSSKEHYLPMRSQDEKKGWFSKPIISINDARKKSSPKESSETKRTERWESNISPMYNDIIRRVDTDDHDKRVHQPNNSNPVNLQPQSPQEHIQRHYRGPRILASRIEGDGGDVDMDDTLFSYGMKNLRPDKWIISPYNGIPLLPGLMEKETDDEGFNIPKQAIPPRAVAPKSPQNAMYSMEGVKENKIDYNTDEGFESFQPKSKGSSIATMKSHGYIDLDDEKEPQIRRFSRPMPDQSQLAIKEPIVTHGRGETILWNKDHVAKPYYGQYQRAAHVPEKSSHSNLIYDSVRSPYVEDKSKYHRMSFDQPMPKVHDTKIMLDISPEVLQASEKRYQEYVEKHRKNIEELKKFQTPTIVPDGFPTSLPLFGKERQEYIKQIAEAGIDLRTPLTDQEMKHVEERIAAINISHHPTDKDDFHQRTQSRAFMKPIPEAVPPRTTQPPKDVVTTGAPTTVIYETVRNPHQPISFPEAHSVPQQHAEFKSIPVQTKDRPMDVNVHQQSTTHHPQHQYRYTRHVSSTTESQPIITTGIPPEYEKFFFKRDEQRTGDLKSAPREAKVGDSDSIINWVAKELNDVVDIEKEHEDAFHKAHGSSLEQLNPLKITEGYQVASKKSSEEQQYVPHNMRETVSMRTQSHPQTRVSQALGPAQSEHLAKMRQQHERLPPNQYSPGSYKRYQPVSKPGWAQRLLDMLNFAADREDGIEETPVQRLVNAAHDTSRQAFDSVQNIAHSVGQDIQSGAEKIVSTLNNTTNQVADRIDRIPAKGVKDAASDVERFIKNATKQTVNTMKSIEEDVVEGLNLDRSKYLGPYSEKGSFKDAAEKMVDKYRYDVETNQNIPEFVKETFRSAPEIGKVIDEGAKSYEELKEAAKDVGSTLVSSTIDYMSKDSPNSPTPPRNSRLASVIEGGPQRAQAGAVHGCIGVNDPFACVSIDSDSDTLYHAETLDWVSSKAETECDYDDSDAVSVATDATDYDY